MRKKTFRFLNNCILIGCDKFSLLSRENSSSAVNVPTNSPAVSDITNRNVFQLNFSHNNEKIWWKHCLLNFTSVRDPLTCWLFEAYSELGLFRHLSNQVFHILQFRKCISYAAHLLFSNCLKFDANFRNTTENWEKKLFSLDNWILIGSSKYSVLGRKYWTSAVNVLINSPKISDITKRGISNSIFLTVMEEYDRSAVVQIWGVFPTL